MGNRRAKALHPAAMPRLGLGLTTAPLHPAAFGIMTAAVFCLRRITGFPDSAREAQLKRVRALQGSGWQTDSARFEELAQATVALAAATLDSARAGSAAQR